MCAWGRDKVCESLRSLLAPRSAKDHIGAGFVCRARRGCLLGGGPLLGAGTGLLAVMSASGVRTSVAEILGASGLLASLPPQLRASLGLLGPLLRGRSALAFRPALALAVLARVASVASAPHDAVISLVGPVAEVLRFADLHPEVAQDLLEGLFRDELQEVLGCRLELRVDTLLGFHACHQVGEGFFASFRFQSFSSPRVNDPDEWVNYA